MQLVNESGRSALFRVTVRPARAVYLIGEGSRDGFRRAVQEASTRWGGACELIVEVRDDGSADADVLRSVRLSHIEGAVNIDAPYKHAVTLAASLGLELTDIAAIDESGITSFTCHPGVLGLPPTLPGYNAFMLAEAGGPLWQAAAVGDLTAEHESTLNTQALVVRRPRTPDETAWAQLWGHALLDRTVEYFREDLPAMIPMPGPGILFVTRGDDLRDCLDFWNLRAIRPLRFWRPPVFILPEEDIAHWMGLPQHFGETLRRQTSVSPDAVLVSRSMDQADLHKAAAVLGLQQTARPAVRSFDLPPLMERRTDPFTYVVGDDIRADFDYERTYGMPTDVDTAVLQDYATLRFPGPIPFSGPGSALTCVSGEPLSALPRRDCIAQLVHASARWRGECIEIGLPVRREYRFELHLPPLPAVVEALVADRTVRHALSDKGALGGGLLSAQAVDALAEPGVFDAIKALTTPRSAHIAKALRQAFGDAIVPGEQFTQIVADLGGRVERTFRSAAHLGLAGVQAPQALAALERLADLGWAERGLQIKCHACKQTSFIELAAVSSRGSARCPGCHSLSAYTTQAGNLAVCYRLDSRIDRASDQGVLPHLLAIAAVTRRDPRTWLLPGVDLEFDDGTHLEADVFGVWAAKVVSGEVKVTGADFDAPGQIDKDIDIALRMRSDVYLMAATTEIPPTAEQHAADLCEQHDLELLVLQPQDLLTQPPDET
jgi:hypothetical protein